MSKVYPFTTKQFYVARVWTSLYLWYDAVVNDRDEFNVVAIKSTTGETMSNKEMKVISRDHFFDLLDKGHEEFRIKTTTPGKNKREITEDAPFDKDDPMSYVLVDLIFDRIEIFAKGDFSAHDIAESERIYGNTRVKTLEQRVSELEALVKTLTVAA